MNILTQLGEAIRTSGEMDRESASILGFCETGIYRRKTPTGRYSPYLRRRDRMRRAA
jgi:hypothetical protein